MIVERWKAWLRGHPFEVWRALQAWRHTPDSAKVWAWFAEECGIYESNTTTDPVALGRAEGMRNAFFLLWDLANADGRDVMEEQRRALHEGVSDDE